MTAVEARAPDPAVSVASVEAAEQRRLQALHHYAVLDTPAEADFDDLTRLACEWFEAPVALIGLLDAHRQWFKSRQGVAWTEMPRALSLCESALIAPHDVTVIEDTRTDARCQAHPLVHGDPGIGFYAGAPLVTPEGEVLGTLAVLDHVPRLFSPRQRETLRRLARQVMALLESRRQHAELRALQSLNEQIVGNAPVGLCLYDETGRCIAANEAMAQLIGATRDQVLAQNFHHIPSWRTFGLHDAAMTCLATGEPRQVTSPMRSTFGRESWFNARFVRLEVGDERRLMLSLTDLTEVKQAELRYQKLFQYTLDGVLQTRPGGEVLSANPAACAILGLTEQQIRERGRNGLLDLEDPRLPGLLAARERDGYARGELRMRRGDGTLIEVEMTSALYSDGDGDRLSSIVFRDIMERRRLERELQQQADLLSHLAENVPGVIYQFRLYPDGRSCFPFSTQGMREIYEVTPEEVREDASTVYARLHPEDLGPVSESIRQSAETLQPWRAEYRVLLPRQGLRWRQGLARPQRLEDGSVLWHGFITDVTDRKAVEARTLQLAYYDALTGLPNRVLLHDRIAQALAQAHRSGQYGAVMFLDLDHFKHINDARGHAVGDQLLREVAQRLQNTVRGEDTVARLGGDEFVLLVKSLGSDRDAGARAAMAVAEKARQAIDQPFDLGGLPYSTTASLGIAIFPCGPQTLDDLLREADTAMYRAKAAGRNGVAFFEDAMQHEVEERLALEQDLKQALARGELELHIQSQVDASGRAVAGEALLRWHHPRQGWVPPARFIPLAEESGLIHPIGDWVIAQACQLLVRLRDAGLPQRLAVNVSPRQFRHEDFVARVQAILEQAGAPADRLIFEVTEGLFIQDWASVQERMAALSRLGIRFSIDDFGTGYSSLAYLQRLPLYEIKIDRGFVADVPQDPNATVITRSILSLAHTLGLEVVAEGVETAEQADFLRHHGCTRLQGFHYARPCPVASWLAGLDPGPTP